MKWLTKNKAILFVVMIIIIFVAGLLDIKYKGLFYQVLPDSIQSYLANFFH
ncbi:hypothetical protein [Rummeliibacillus sp. POC4]|uniref:hypothetical protein n=1 Tax=Rummeliibacillus sp. POC4 TaxID=2305899 RepID=UPI001F25172D|nr:hypothetical protein [Rummeliibacillus sp. POC4]